MPEFASEIQNTLIDVHTNKRPLCVDDMIDNKNDAINGEEDSGGGGIFTQRKLEFLEEFCIDCNT